MNIEFLQALKEIEKEKNIPKDLLLEAIEAAMISAYKKNFGVSHNVRATIDRATGNVQVLANKTVVAEVENPQLEISLEEGREFDPDCQIDDLVEIEVTPANFGRIAAQTAKQVVVQKIKEAEREIIFEEFSSRVGDIVTGVVQRLSNQNVMIDIGKAEAILIPPEQMRTDNYKPGARIKIYIVEVKQTTKGPRIMVSRTHPSLLKRLFELEVPEIYEGVVEIKAIAREAGSRSKIAVYSADENIDPVGACVGQKGMRVKAIVDEINGEKIDIIEWSPERTTFIANSLSPAKVVHVEVNQDEKMARVVVPDYQLSLGIGKEGQNARLAAKLTGWRIDIKSESQMAELAKQEDSETWDSIVAAEEEQVVSIEQDAGESADSEVGSDLEDEVESTEEDRVEEAVQDVSHVDETDAKIISVDADEPAGEDDDEPSGDNIEEEADKDAGEAAKEDFLSEDEIDTDEAEENKD